jgi:MFS family permease
MSHHLRNFQTQIAQRMNPESKFVRVFRHRDFRLLWAGAFLSFMGSWIQIVAQGYLVYEITGSKEKLALISFCSMIPVTFLGPFAGSFVDTMNKRILLAWTQVLFAVSALTIGVLNYFHLVKVEHLVIAALFNGLVSCVEMPARQAVVGASVPKEDLPLAIPFQGLTFNLPRVIGPAVGGILLKTVGVQGCYIVNAISFFAMIFACLAIRVDTKATLERGGQMLDLIMEGCLYTLREPRLKVLFILETAVSLFGLFYLAQLPAIAKDILQLDEQGVGGVYTAVGFGSIAALTLTSKTADLHVKGYLVRGAITVMAVGLGTLSFATLPVVAFIILGVLGFGSVVLFNTCNSLFQMIAPEQLRGRVISMHIWALSGVGPLGVYPFGLIAEKYGLPFALQLSCAFMFLIALWGWTRKLRLEAN